MGLNYKSPSLEYTSANCKSSQCKNITTPYGHPQCLVLLACINTPFIQNVEQLGGLIETVTKNKPIPKHCTKHLDTNNMYSFLDSTIGGDEDV